MLVAEIWAALAEGRISEAEAERLDAMHRAPCRQLAKRPGHAPRARAPRPPPREDVERRRRWAAAGRLPPQVAQRFTPGETAVLAALAWAVGRFGACTLPLAALARLAGVQRTTARNAIREARRLGLVQVQERRRSRWRSDTNVVRVLDRGWLAWIERRGGVKSAKPSNIKEIPRAIEGQGLPSTAARHLDSRRIGRAEAWASERRRAKPSRA